MRKTKIKSLLPSLREKKRYVVFEVISDNKISSQQQIMDAINYTALQFLGEFGYGNAGIKVISDIWNDELQRGIVKVSNKHVESLKTVFMLIKDIDKQETIVRSIGTSGILKKAKNKYLSNK